MAKSATRRKASAEKPVSAAGGGILPAQDLRSLAEAGAIRALMPFAARQVQPASLDLRLGEHAYRVRASFLPRPGLGVAARLDDLALHRIDLTQGAVLETGCVYVVPLLESLLLPPDIAAAANPKSSTGRLDVFTRVIADGVAAFDTVPAGYSGPLYAEICPQTFPVLVRTGSTLSQLRFRRGQATISDAELSELHARERLVSGGAVAGADSGIASVAGIQSAIPAEIEADIQGGIALSVDLLGDAAGLVGYRAKRHTGLVDVDQPGACSLLDYWEPIHARAQRRLILDPDQFYILASKEAVHVPPTHAAEMVPFNPLVGEFRVHYAGFMDPGFGHAAAGGTGARVVLEVRSHKVPFVLEDAQVVGRLVYERMLAVPDKLYGRDLGSNYQAQGLKLSKHFK